MPLDLGASRPGLSQVHFSEVQLFPVLLLAVPSLSLGFPRLTSGLTCYLTFFWIADCWMVLPVQQWGLTPRFPTPVDQPQNPYWSNMEVAVPPVNTVLLPISLMWPFLILRSLFTVTCEKSPKKQKPFRKRKENIHYFWSLWFVKMSFSSSLYIKYWWQYMKAKYHI